ncbi:MAG: carboxypeptidase M32 [Nitrospinae bacterium]|nr:carboxypeptidase M32 [Nitrospinota bacterium]
MSSNYQKLVQRLEETSRLGGIMGILHWDQEVIMPTGAADSRAKQMGVLAGIIHEKSTDPAIGELLDNLNQENSFNSFERCNIDEARRDYEMETKVPKSLVMELAELSSKGHQVWVKARSENRFSDFAPVLSQLIELKKRWAEYVSPNLHAYDANIDVYERGMKTDDITPVFERLKSELIPLIREIQASDYKPDSAFLSGDFSVDKQEALGRAISEEMGFAFDRGRMDVSVHPFCGGSHPTDVRITTRYRTDNFIESLYAVIHETGHGLYEQGRMKEGRDLPASEALTMGVHESQSLFWERMIAQNRPFCKRYFPLIAKTFPENFNGVSVDQFYEAVNTSQPSFIRVEADEVTYPMHVILRYEIEKGLFDGSIEVKTLPELWNSKMKEYLGVEPPTDTLGVLQDTHWSGGAFGYFPSYTLGAIYASQFYQTLIDEKPDLGKEIESGNLATIREWLNQKIHQKGRLLSVPELIKEVTGDNLNPTVFLNYLKTKYRTIYRLN